jgi:hypothetical protein
MRRAASIVLAAMVVLSVLSAGIALGQDSDRVERLELDRTTPLFSDSAVSEYQSSGSVLRNSTRLNARFGYLNSLDGYSPACGTTPDTNFAREGASEWLIIEYCEDLPRTLRLTVPREYFTPVTAQSDALGGGPTATFQPVDGRNGTAVEVTIQEPGVVAIPVSVTDTAVFGTLTDWRDRVEDGVGVDVPVPFLDGGSQWSHVTGTTVEARGSVAIDGTPDDVVVQYRYTESDGEVTWINAPSMERSSAPVYLQTRDGVNDTVWVVASDADPPDIRYKQDASSRDVVGGVIDDIRSFDEKARERWPF